MPWLLKIFRLEEVVVHARGGDLAERCRLKACEGTIHLNTLAKEAEHVMTDRSGRFAGFHDIKTINVVQEWTDVLQTALCFSWNNIN